METYTFANQTPAICFYLTYIDVFSIYLFFPNVVFTLLVKRYSVVFELLFWLKAVFCSSLIHFLNKLLCFCTSTQSDIA